MSWSPLALQAVSRALQQQPILHPKPKTGSAEEQSESAEDHSDSVPPREPLQSLGVDHQWRVYRAMVLAFCSDTQCYLVRTHMRDVKDLFWDLVNSDPSTLAELVGCLQENLRRCKKTRWPKECAGYRHVVTSVIRSYIGDATALLKRVDRSTLRAVGCRAEIWMYMRRVMILSDRPSMKYTSDERFLAFSFLIGAEGAYRRLWSGNNSQGRPTSEEGAAEGEDGQSSGRAPTHTCACITGLKGLSSREGPKRKRPSDAELASRLSGDYRPSSLSNEVVFNPKPKQERRSLKSVTSSRHQIVLRWKRQKIAQRRK